LCDVDDARARKAFDEFPKARKYADFRVMFDREKYLDAVVISTPDHTHAVAAVAAMQRGLHVFCQKPLTHSVEEARVLRRVAARERVVTQMGNQGMAMDGVRRAAEVVRSGAIGEVRDVHVWTDRPVWQQGIARPPEIQPIPAALRWDLWLGPARHRPYHSSYAPFHWRGFWDFGTGALGDMACHTMNMAFFALELDAPTAVEVDAEGGTDESPPPSTIVRYEFPARGERPPVALTWYDGGEMPPLELFPADALVDGEPNKFGTLMLGDKGALYSPGHYGETFRLLPEADFAGYEGPEPTLLRSPGIHEEWLAGCKGGVEPMSNFDRAGRFTEAVLLGNVALRSGERIEWDPGRLRVTNSEQANRYVRDEYSYGYSIDDE
jgi:predicted dehydrogenase